MEKKYYCYTDKGSWFFYAADSLDAARLGLFLAWRDGEVFDHIVDDHGNIIRLCSINRNGYIETL